MKTEEFLTFARRMRAGGIPLHIEEDDQDGPHSPASGLLIETEGGEVETTAFDIPPYQTGYMIPLRITVNLTHFAISDFDLELPWEDRSLRMLEDPLQCGIDPPLYIFPGKHGDEYLRDLGINHCANSSQMLTRGQSIIGCLFVVGTRMPNRIKHGEIVPAMLYVIDQFNRRYPSPVSLWACRTEKIDAKPLKKPHRKRIFDESDADFGQPLAPGAGISVDKQRRQIKKLSNEARVVR